MSEESVATVETKVRTASVSREVFARIYRRVANAGGTVEDVIQGVFDETGIGMNAANVAVKASSLRNKGVNLGNLPRKSSAKFNIDSLNAVLDAESKADETVATETVESEQAAS